MKRLSVFLVTFIVCSCFAEKTAVLSAKPNVYYDKMSYDIYVNNVLGGTIVYDWEYDEERGLRGASIKRKFETTRSVIRIKLLDYNGDWIESILIHAEGGLKYIENDGRTTFLRHNPQNKQ